MGHNVRFSKVLQVCVAVTPRMNIVVAVFFLFTVFQGYHAQKTVKGQAPLSRVRVTTPSDWIHKSLEAHNYFRELHGSSPLVLNNTLSEISQHYANELLNINLQRMAKQQNSIYFEHNKAAGSARIGENLYYSIMTVPIEPIPASYAVALWYEEIKDYDFFTTERKLTSDPHAKIGHLTQVLWNSTKQMGTAYASKKLANNQIIVFVVANYWETGNLVLRGNKPKFYLENVFPSSLSEADINAAIVSKNVESWWSEPLPTTVSLKSWRNSLLENHNKYRSSHGAQPLRLNSDLCKVSQLWVNHLLAKGIEEFNHYEGLRRIEQNFVGVHICNLGENSVYFLTKHDNGNAFQDDVVKLWYDQGIKQYDFKSKGQIQSSFNSKLTDGFEQIVWNSTTEFCASYAGGITNNGQYLMYITANYYPSITLREEDRKINIFPASGGRNVSLPAGAAMLISEVTTLLVFTFYLFVNNLK